MKQEALEVFRQTYHPELVARLYTRLGLPLPTDAPPENAPTPAEEPR
jgi:hypothetical protein